MNLLAVVPARFDSIRFPGKPLAKILDKEMLAWVVEGIQAADVFNEIIVATDHPEIATLAEKLNVSAAMTDKDIPTGTDRVYAASTNKDFDWVFNIQGDEPLVSAAALQGLAQLCENREDLNMATLASKLKQEDLQNPNAVKVICNQHNEAIYFSRFPIPFSRDPNYQEDVAFQHIGIYAYRKNFLKRYCEQPPTALEKKESLEQLRALYMGEKIGVLVGDFETVGVDEPEDVARVEKILRSRV
tara:strand:- start:11596 stop:12327 length:732 start_codon:yes stop_codon:yes gene_type:complete